MPQSIKTSPTSAESQGKKTEARRGPRDGLETYHALTSRPYTHYSSCAVITTTTITTITIITRE
ncbi:hypothetical protein E2C01_038501 [Portunus trituberculatus]|uniref:Uncharacterized protein n=1 Tax=Portunus trituberculatus TaxID=210409 RepID=A0A5B7FCD8_PORTR|nr:hypothetical protein [Portunus trituberculatus]